MPEFVHSEGLNCLIRVGAAADHNYQSYILRGQRHTFPLTFDPMPLSTPTPTHLFPFLSLALGQLMLFVDGMLGVVAHSETVQWLYTLCASLVSGSVQTSTLSLLFLLSLSSLFYEVGRIGVNLRALEN